MIALAIAGVLAIVAGPSLVGPFGPRIGAGLIPAVIVGLAVIRVGPRAADRLSWRALLAGVLMASISWCVALAASDGIDALSAPVARPSEYLASSATISSPGSFLSSFTDRIDAYPVHVRGHPPGMVLLLWGLGRVGFGGQGWAAGLMIVVGCSAVVAALIAAREAAGEQAARRAAPFLALIPAAVWIATSADALFMGVSAWGVTLLVLASGRDGLLANVLSLIGGVVLGAALFLTYGAVPLLCVPAFVMLARRRIRLMLVASMGAAIVAVAFAANGFWWPDGLLATRREYLAGAAANRGYLFFLFANLGALALAAGPAAVAGLGVLRRRGLWLLVVGAIVAVVLADLSGMSRGEVERIWLLFVPWLALAASELVPSAARVWLTANAGMGLALQALLRSPW